MQHLTLTNLVSPLIRLNPADNVAVARTRIDPADMPEIEGIRPLGRIPRGHKMALEPVGRGRPSSSTARSSALRPRISLRVSMFMSTTLRLGIFHATMP